MRGNQVQWIDERVRVLLELWAAGATADAIAAHLGVSREAVLGKIFRLRRTAPLLHLEAPTRRRRSKRNARVERSRDAPKPCRRKTVLDLTNNSCRWAYGEPGTFFFCAKPEANLERQIPYCRRHMKLAYGAACSVSQ
jgi:GcrA cell cycle regulator